MRRVPDEDAELTRVEEPGDRTLIDRLMQPLNRGGTRRFLKEARRKCWRNAQRLSIARGVGPDAYAAELALLEELSRRKVADLVTPRFVIMRLVSAGFGVELPDGRLIQT